MRMGAQQQLEYNITLADHDFSRPQSSIFIPIVFFLLFFSEKIRLDILSEFLA